MMRRMRAMSLIFLLLAILIAASGCSLELFCLEYDVVPQPTAVAAAPSQAPIPQAAQPRSMLETVKAFLTLYPCLQDVLGAIAANQAIPVPVEYHKRFVLLRIGR